MAPFAEAATEVFRQSIELALRHVPLPQDKDEHDDDEPPVCSSGNEYDGRMGVRISSIFVIMVGGGIGVFFPILLSRYSAIRMPWWCFFIAKFFGSGVIVATAFIHLLDPAVEALGNECLTGPVTEYPWAIATCLMMIFLMFLIEIIAYGLSNEHRQEGGHTHSHFGAEDLYVRGAGMEKGAIDKVDKDDLSEFLDNHDNTVPAPQLTAPQDAFTKHYSHADNHQDHEILGTPAEDISKEKYAGSLIGIFFLEFGILFHSVFTGLALAVAGDEFITLYIVLIFHQMFEGFGLGLRIATTNWGKHRWTPWVFAAAFALVTPVAIAIGLGVRKSYAPGSRTALLVNGVFDALLAGVLIYTGLVELMAHEFLFSLEFKGPNGFRKMLWAYFIMCWGGGLMALLGYWA